MHKTEPSEAVTSLHDLSAVDLIAGYRAKQFSPSEVLEEVIAHVARMGAAHQGAVSDDPEGARDVAKASTDRWQKGEPIGTLDGVPVTIKDNIATKGRRCRWARPASSWCPPRATRRPPRGCAKPAR